VRDSENPFYGLAGWFLIISLKVFAAAFLIAAVMTPVLAVFDLFGLTAAIISAGVIAIGAWAVVYYLRILLPGQLKHAAERTAVQMAEDLSEELEDDE
jgi:hypothetical protein